MDTANVNADADHPMHGKVWVLDNKDLGYQAITIDQPLRLRFELTKATLDALAESRLSRDVDALEGVLESLKELIGTVWTDKQSALAEIERTVVGSGIPWPTAPAFPRAVARAIGVSHPEGVVQKKDGIPLPDRHQRRTVRVPLSADVNDYLHNEVLPHTPGAWIDPAGTRIGYEVSPMLFFSSTLDTRFVPLREVAEHYFVRVGSNTGENPPRHLRAQDLHSVDSAEELPEAVENTRRLTLCTGGDLVGSPRGWRVLPPGFGDAATSLPVLRPRGHYGRALCEWLNSRDDGTISRDMWRRPPDDLPVPIELVTDVLLDDLLEDVQKNRRTVREAMSTLLPNLFSETKPQSTDRLCC